MRKTRIPPAWSPFKRTHVLTAPDGSEFVIPDGMKCYVNTIYQVFVRDLGDVQPFGKILHFSIKRNDRAPIRSWRDLQRIKNELAGPEAEAVELFPAESRLVDTANQYHLYVFPGFRFNFGFTEREVMTPKEAAKVGAVQS